MAEQSTNQAAAPEESAAGVKVKRIQFEHLTDPLGIGVAQPRLSWRVETQAKGWQQAAYEVEAYTPDGEDGGQLCGSTGRVESGELVLVDWPFEALASRERVEVRARVWGQEGQASDWSAHAPVEAGLLNASDWTARFVRPAWEEDTSQAQPSPMLRKTFTLRGAARQARLYVTALGLYEAQINGEVVGDQVMAPGWTSYSHRLRYQTYDVTEMLHEGRNAMGALLGDGWFRGRMGFGGGRPNIYGDRIALLAQLEVTYADGSSETIVTDESWRAATGPVLYNDIYNGEIYDARRERSGWAAANYDDSAWSAVSPVERDLATLFAPYGPPVRRTQLLEPVSITKSPTGRTVVDFGQNLVGRLRISVQGPAGETVTLRHAEVLENGDLCTRPLRHAKATDQYTLKGEGVETWEPRFTFHGFRYAEVENWPGELNSDDLRAVVCHSDMERTGWFECSDPLVNRFHENVVWSMRGNFLDIPTDCPQRDERLGWTGDIQVFSPTASYLFDVSGFLSSWLADLAAEQKQYGVVPFVVPNTLPRETPPAAAWGDAAVIIPWVLYQRFGDAKILEDQFESMKAWVDLIDQTAGEGHLWDQGFQFGDWLDPAAPPERPADARTPAFLVASAYFARSAELLGKAAEVLGKTGEAQHYRKLAQAIREAFNREYVTPSGRLMSDASSAYALALEFDLLPEEGQRLHAGQRLAELARASRYRISTGFVGTPLICDALCSAGQVETAFRLITQQECPSWLYPVTMDATTIWERWDSMRPDGSVNPGEMTSFNHYALGSVADWLHRTVGGLASAAPGYRQITFQPIPGRFSSASTRHITPYGPAACAWEIADGKIKVAVEVPPNTTAQVILPGDAGEGPFEVGPGQYSWSYPYQAEQVQRGPLTPDSTVGELIDNDQAFALALEILRKYGTELADRMFAQESMSLRQAVSFMPQGEAIITELASAFAGLNE